MKEQEKYIETAWKDYSNKLLSFIRAKVSSHEDAEDILSDVFLKLAKQTDLARVPHKLSGWLYQVTRNAIIDFYRSKRLLESLPEDLIQDQSKLEAISTLSTCILPMIEELPDTYKLPILRSEVDGKTQKQVADELNLSLAAVKSRILRGRKRLKHLMARRCTFYYNSHGQLIDYKEKSTGISGHTVN